MDSNATTQPIREVTTIEVLPPAGSLAAMMRSADILPLHEQRELFFGPQFGRGHVVAIERHASSPTAYYIVRSEMHKREFRAHPNLITRLLARPNGPSPSRKSVRTPDGIKRLTAIVEEVLETARSVKAPDHS